MSYKYLLFIVIPVLVALFAITFTVCENCIKSCIIFSYNSADQCVKDCGNNVWSMCGYTDNRFNNWLNWWHTDDYSYMLTDLPECKTNPNSKLIEYAATPVLTTKRTLNSKSDKKPNLILIVLDDQDVYSPYWEAMPFAKELFQQNGTHFINGYTSTSFCCPARCQIFTGMYGHNNGVQSSYGSFGSVNAFRKPLHLNGTRMKDELGKCINNENRTLPLFLQKYGGYKTAMFGKYLNGFENDRWHTINYVPPGWNQFDVTTNNYQYIGNMYVMTEWDDKTNNLKYKWHGREQKDYLTDVITEKSVKFIRKQREQNTDPLFMYLAPTAPHFPQMSERHKDTIKYWESRFEEIVESRPNYHSDESVKTKPSWLKDNADYRDNILEMEVNNWYEKKTLNIHKLEFAKRMSTLYAVDEMIQKIYTELLERGEADNTVWGLVSDNGFLMGAHKLYHKMAPYDESTKVPYYLSGPSIKKGYIDNRLVLLNDLAPTFLDLAGFDVPNHMDGFHLTDPKKKRSAVLLEYGRHADNEKEKFTGTLTRVPEFQMVVKIAPKYISMDVPPYIGIRTHNHLYAEYYNVSDSNYREYELYDTVVDPYQMNNIYNANTTNPALITFLRNSLSKLKTCYGQECNF